jgi:hypothetical protein
MHKRFLAAALFSIIIVSAGCKPQHPSKITVDPEFNANQLGSILIAPFISSISEGEDPDRESERVMNSLLLDIIKDRTDHRFLSPEHFMLAIRKAKLDEEYERFKNDWITKHEIDKDFLIGLKGELEIDAVLIPHVYLWNKDEADYRESATASSTSVGASLSLVDFETGKISWEAMDENFKEAVRTEGNREQVTTYGVTRRVSGVTATGRDMYGAPPFEDVAQLVLMALVDAIPERGAL